MQKPKLLTSAIAIALSASSAAQGQVTVDIAKMTCGQFATYKIASPKSIATWLSGYHHGARGDTIVDTQQLDTDTKNIQDYCIDNPDALLMQAVEKILGPSK